MFESLNPVSPPRSGRTLLVSLLIHLVVIGTLLAVPLLYFQQLPAAEFVSFLAPPPEPPAPPSLPPPAAAAPPRSGQPVVLALDAVFVEPQEVPNEIPEAPEVVPRVPAWALQGGQGVPGGVFPGAEGAGTRVPGIVPSAGEFGAPPAPVPPPPRREPQPRGGDVQQAKLIQRVNPVYPPLAIRARVQGSVVLRAIIDEEGRVEALRLISGHPLLNQTALEAVRQWRYSPTLLNGEPVRVVTTVTVNFQLR